MPPFPPLIVRRLGLIPYTEAWHAMRAFTEARDPESPDEVWLLEHPPVYTIGWNGKGVPKRSDIPLIRSDRGGDITYHGPGQLIFYVLLDLKRHRIGVRELVATLEEITIDWLEKIGVAGARRAGAPGVYVGNGKIAALGLRIRRGCSYHGLSLNVAMDLTPFSSIVPCGLKDVGVAQATDLVRTADLTQAADALTENFLRRFWPHPLHRATL